MRLSRRAFALGLTSAAFVTGAGAAAQVVERRVYGPGGVLPPRDLLDRSGIRMLSIRAAERGIEYIMGFDSLGARARAWDRFNTDPEWSALRERGEVRLREIVVG